MLLTCTSIHHLPYIQVVSKYIHNKSALDPSPSSLMNRYEDEQSSY